MRDRIVINKELVPYAFKILLADQWFELYVNYNETAELFTVTLFKDDKLVCTEPVILDVPLFKDVYQPKLFPAVEIVPVGGANDTAVTYDNLGETVHLTIDDEGD